jgi:hypothetical protein
MCWAQTIFFCLKCLFSRPIRFHFDSAAQGGSTPPSSYDPGPLYVGFVVHEVVLSQVFLRSSEYFIFPLYISANARFLAIDIIVKWHCFFLKKRSLVGYTAVLKTIREISVNNSGYPLGTTQPSEQRLPRLRPAVQVAEAWRWPPIPSTAEVKERVELRPPALHGLLYGEFYFRNSKHSKAWEEIKCTINIGNVLNPEEGGSSPKSASNITSQ